MKLKDYVQNKPKLETDRLLLRPLQYDDVADLKEWIGDRSLYQYWGKRPGKSDLNPELLFQKKERPTKSFHWGIVHKKDDKVIGEMWIYLIENDRMAYKQPRQSKVSVEKQTAGQSLAPAKTFRLQCPLTI